jgi:tRNA (cytidine/uridine-2'-O-)-methyltransferase
LVSVALYQPDIAPNVGAILRLCACLEVAVHIIEPAGFAWSEKSLHRTGLDYIEHAKIIRHWSFAALKAATTGRRLVLLSTKADLSYVRFGFADDDVLLFGRETAGVPREVHGAVDVRLVIPMRRGMRSLNVALACAMVTGEALRQTRTFPADGPPRQQMRPRGSGAKPGL